MMTEGRPGAGKSYISVQTLISLGKETQTTIRQRRASKSPSSYERGYLHATVFVLSLVAPDLAASEFPGILDASSTDQPF